MKTLLTTLFLFATSCCFSQDCAKYYLLQNNKTIEMSIFNKKGKVTGKQVYTVSNVNTSGGATTATIQSEMFDDNNKSIATATNSIQCKGGVMMMNMKMMLPQRQQEQPVTNAEVKAESIYIDYPANMAVGDELKEGNFSMDMEVNGMKQQLNMVVNNRKVEAKETITTTAGTWDCYKINYKSKMTMKTLGIGIPISMTGTEWFAPSFGIVKTVSNYGGTEITAIK